MRFSYCDHFPQKTPYDILLGQFSPPEFPKSSAPVSSFSSLICRWKTTPLFWAGTDWKFMCNSSEFSQ